MKLASETISNRPKPCTSLKNAPRIFRVRCSLLSLVGRTHAVVRDQLFPQKFPSSRLLFSRTRFQHPPGSLTIELPSALAAYGRHPTDGAAVRLSATVLPYSRVPPPPEGPQIGAQKRRAPGEHHPLPTIPSPRPTG